MSEHLTGDERAARGLDLPKEVITGMADHYHEVRYLNGCYNPDCEYRDEIKKAGRYQSKPSVIEAVHWTGDNSNEIVAAFGDKVRNTALTVYGTTEPVGIELLAGKDGAQGWVSVPVGHWIVGNPGDLSDLWPVDNAYFENKYDAIS